MPAAQRREVEFPAGNFIGQGAAPGKSGTVVNVLNYRKVQLDYGPTRALARECRNAHPQ